MLAKSMQLKTATTEDFGLIGRAKALSTGVHLVAKSPAAVPIAGTGKGNVARAIHLRAHERHIHLSQ